MGAGCSEIDREKIIPKNLSRQKKGTSRNSPYVCAGCYGPAGWPPGRLVAGSPPGAARRRSGDGKDAICQCQAGFLRPGWVARTAPAPKMELNSRFQYAVEQSKGSKDLQVGPGWQIPSPFPLGYPRVTFSRQGKIQVTPTQDVPADPGLPKYPLTGSPTATNALGSRGSPAARRFRLGLRGSWGVGEISLTPKGDLQPSSHGIGQSHTVLYHQLPSPSCWERPCILPVRAPIGGWFGTRGSS